MKYIFKYLILLTIIVSILICIVMSRYDLMTETIILNKNNLFSYDGSKMTQALEELTISNIIETSHKKPLNKIYKVGEEQANLFSLSYVSNKLKLGDTLKLNEEEKKYASDQLWILFRESYPNVSLKEMGLNSEEEAYQAMQLAIWEIALRTGESKYGSELSKIDSIRADIGESKVNSRVFNKAKQLVALVEEKAYEGVTMVPTLVINTTNENRSLISDEEYRMAGEYRYRVEAAVVTKVDIEVKDLSGKNVKGVIVDESGKEIRNYKNINSFYVKIPKDYEGKLEINFKVEVKRSTPVIYTKNEADYLVDAYTINSMERSITREI